MIKIGRNECFRLHEIFTHNRSRDEDFSIHDIVDLKNLMNTYDVKTEPLCNSLIYWQFLHACLNYIENGYWSSLPTMWVEILCVSRSDELSDFQIESEYKVYLEARRKMCDRLNLPSESYEDDKVKLYWLRKKHGEFYMLGVSHALLRAYLYFMNINFKGIQNNAAQPGESSFNYVDQSILPLDGDNKYEVVRDNFKQPYSRHEKMV